MDFPVKQNLNQIRIVMEKALLKLVPGTDISAEYDLGYFQQQLSSILGVVSIDKSTAHRTTYWQDSPTQRNTSS